MALGWLQAAAQAPHALTAEDRRWVDEKVAKMSLEQKLAYIGGTGFAVRAVPELGLPAWEMSDGPYGVRSNRGLPSATYASGIGLAASWDRTLAARVGEGIGRDARARGVHYMLGPGTNIYRSPRNGRNFEYFGEDPYLAGEMVVGYVTGMQTQGVSATVKHYAANNSEALRHDSDSVVDERTLREIYLPAFEAAVKRGHVGAIMDSYNLINGEHATQNAYLNTEIARREWKFQGTLMSDWDATYDGVAAANGGLDLEMPTGKFMNAASLGPALKNGTLSQATLDEKVRHILETAAMFGWQTREQRLPEVSLDDAESNRTALQSARESVVLLKNDGALLPLDRSKVKTVLVVGPGAYPGVPVGGGSAGVVPFHAVSLLEGLNEAGGSGLKVLYEPGLPSSQELAEKTAWMTAAAGGQAGVLYQVYDARDLSGAATEGVTSRISEGGSGRGAPPAPKGHSRRYTGFYNASTDGEYLLAMAGEGEGSGNRVLVDGKLVIDNWEIVRAFEPHLTMHLGAGMHRVVVEVWQRGSTVGRLRVGLVREDEVVNAAAKKLAAMADVVVVSAGFSPNPDYSEGEGGDRTFDLPYGQDALIEAMAAANPRTIVTVASGGNVDSSRWIARIPALLEGWYGGQEAGQAMAEVLFGEVNPSGHLPATFERRAEDNPTSGHYEPVGSGRRIEYKEGIFVGYRGYEKNHVQPLFPFGFGMSYTTFSMSGLKVLKGAGATATVEFDVKNTGSRKGAEVAQVYVTEDHPRLERPAHELKGFERVELAPGETKHVTVPLDARAFAYYDVAAKEWVVNAGEFTVSVGDSVAALPLSGKVRVEAARLGQ